MEKAREFQKNIYFCFIDYAKAFDCVDHNTLWTILKAPRVKLGCRGTFGVASKVLSAVSNFKMERETSLETCCCEVASVVSDSV